MKFLLWPRPPIQYGGGEPEVYLEFHLKFGIHDTLRQNLTNHQIPMRISIVSTNRHGCQHIVVNCEFFYRQTFNMAADKPEVVLNLKINSTAEKFSRISLIFLDIYVAGFIAEHLIHNGSSEIQNGGKTESSYNFERIVSRKAIFKANTMSLRVANTTER
jgi:hypothetical protein